MMRPKGVMMMDVTYDKFPKSQLSFTKFQKYLKEIMIYIYIYIYFEKKYLNHNSPSVFLQISEIFEKKHDIFRNPYYIIAVSVCMYVCVT